jgi:hypothetical protein
MNRDDDIEQIIRRAQQTSPDQMGLQIVVMLALICKAVRDLQRKNAT